MSAARLSPEAVDELSEAAAWYRDRQPLDLIIRRALLPRFPYAVVFIDLGAEIRILALAHAKRQPGYWLDRVET